MIRARVTTDFPSGVEEFSNEALVYQGMAERMGVLARGMIIERMQNALGPEKAKHFAVSVMPHPMGITINVEGVDEVATYIFHGSGPHSITASGSAMPVGDGIFATSVNHPGFDGVSTEMEEAIYAAALEAWGMVMFYG